MRAVTIHILFVLIAMISGCASAPSSPNSPSQPADLLITNARIIDGTGKTAFRGDVAVRGDRIIAVGDLGHLGAVRTIDASGLVIAPGFIDVHTHADEDLYKQPLAENFVRDGVTTIVTGNCGYGVTDVGEYFEKLRQRGTAINVATLIGHNAVLRAVKGNRAGELTPEQMDTAR